jgi:hypothetical protein
MAAPVLMAVGPVSVVTAERLVPVTNRAVAQVVLEEPVLQAATPEVSRLHRQPMDSLRLKACRLAPLLPGPVWRAAQAARLAIPIAPMVPAVLAELELSEATGV